MTTALAEPAVLAAAKDALYPDLDEQCVPYKLGIFITLYMGTLEPIDGKTYQD